MGTSYDHVVDHVLYLHRDKDSNWNTWEEDLGQPENDAGMRFKYAGYEVGLQCTVNLQTGECVAYGIWDGKTLVEFERPVELT